MNQAYKLTVKANNERSFSYTVDPSGMMANYCSISTTVNRKPIEGDIKIVTKEIVKKMIENKILVNQLDKIEWNYEKIVGNYFDNEGNLYYNIDNILYQFMYSSNYLHKYFDEF